MVNIENLKKEAMTLLKNLRSTNPDLISHAARQLQQLSTFSQLSLTDIINKKDTVILKHTLDVIAIENGFSNWEEVKLKSEEAAPVKKFFYNKITGELDYNHNSGDSFVNTWYVTYQEAKEHLNKNGGYLLPYKNQYFICGAGYIESLGLDPSDKDWEAIGWDWVKPKDQTAADRIKEKLLRVNS